MAQQEWTDGKWRFWRQLIEAWRGSDETIRGFCQRHGISEPSFYSWRRRIEAAEQVESSSPTFAEVRLTEAAVPAGASTDDRVELVLGSGDRLHVGANVSAEHLRRVLTVAREVGGC